jgi:hypothetical protein
MPQGEGGTAASQSGNLKQKRRSDTLPKTEGPTQPKAKKVERCDTKSETQQPKPSQPQAKRH